MNNIPALETPLVKNINNPPTPQTGESQLSRDVRDSSKNPKLYIGALSPNVTQHTLLSYFERYGEVAECVLMIEKGSQISKGFGFVTYASPEIASFVVQQIHFIEDRKIDVKKARPKDITRDSGFKVEESNDRGTSTKIFVGGLPADTREEEMMETFSIFGKILEVVVVPDRQNRIERSYGFVKFEDPTAVDHIMENYYDVKVRGRWVECKLALNQKSRKQGNSQRDRPTETINYAPTSIVQVDEGPEPFYGHKKYLEYDETPQDQGYYPEYLCDSPPIYITPMTPPKIRTDGYRTKYLKKRRIEELESSEVSFKETGFDYFEALNGKKLKAKPHSGQKVFLSSSEKQGDNVSSQLRKDLKSVVKRPTFFIQNYQQK